MCALFALAADQEGTGRQLPKPKGVGLVSGATDASASETIGWLTTAHRRRSVGDAIPSTFYPAADFICRNRQC